MSSATTTGSDGTAPRHHVAIVGAAGNVGSATAFAMTLSPFVQRVTLVDHRPERAEVHAMDLEQVCAGLGHHCVVDTGDVAAGVGADTMVVAASAPLAPGTAHGDQLLPNARIARALAADVAATGRLPRRLVVSTAPVEALTTYLRRELAAARDAVVGYTLNDTTRLRVAIARSLDVDPRAVDAWSLGVLGSHPVRVFSRVHVGGRRVDLEPAAKQRVLDYLANWFPRWLAREPTRTSAWMTAYGLSALVARFASEDASVVPMAVTLDGEYGMSDVAVTVPVEVPAVRVVESPLADEEARALNEAGAAVEDAVGRIYREVGGP